ncbi:S-adenosylmethionine-dependent methyltransferase (SAM or AdoMet-MTase) isoform 1 [Dorcoceras hygrometricum]|uniref:S-adenosylmethionine-dependent methyltransferase (SAM or AdoMet-MTase) isoform 1 n=1 Tax=Dorcoceras hygrometricum TaxID=472368 RepID=A0A2Z7B9G8_9LAMI|nr:S-adenosylmethionine-dependent methyltransferase (SAM or AdoMet-MTase) isoform 1 [Dorcoceras hygrometricum]
MIEFRSTQSESEVSVSSIDNMHQPKDVDIMTQVLGPRSRYVKGLGPLPKLSIVGGSRATNLRTTYHDVSEKISTMFLASAELEIEWPVRNWTLIAELVVWPAQCETGL